MPFLPPNQQCQSTESNTLNPQKHLLDMTASSDTPTVSRYAVGDNKGDIAVAQKACLNSDMRHAGHLCALLYRQVGMQTGRQQSRQ